MQYRLRSPSPSRALRKRRRRRLTALLIPVVAAAALLVVPSFIFRHVPFTIPPSLAAPTANPGAAGSRLTLRYTGVSGYELTDGNTVILLDPSLTRPPWWQLALGPLRPDDEALAKVFPRADYILVNHAHYDHGADAPSIALRTGATVVGTQSMTNLAQSRGVPAAQLRTVRGGEVLQLGTFTVRVDAVQHSPILWMDNPMYGVIPADAGGLWAWQYQQDGTLIFHLQSGDQSVLFHPSSRYLGQQLPPADTIIFGLAGRKLTSDTLAAITEHTRPQLIVPTHFDNFFQPRERGLSLLPTLNTVETWWLLEQQSYSTKVYLLDYDQTVTLPTPL